MSNFTISAYDVKVHNNISAINDLSSDKVITNELNPNDGSTISVNGHMYMDGAKYLHVNKIGTSYHETSGTGYDGNNSILIDGNLVVDGTLTGTLSNPHVSGVSAPTSGSEPSTLLGINTGTGEIQSRNLTSLKLKINEGGTNSTTALNGSSIMVSNGSAIVQGAKGTGTQVLHGNASGAPTYSAVLLSSDVTGTLSVANGGTGQTSYTNGQLLIGNSTGGILNKAALTAGSNINITNGPGSITITGSDTFSELTATKGNFGANQTMSSSNALNVRGGSGANFANFYLSGLTHPIFQIMPHSSNNVQLNFDTYYSGSSWHSSNGNSNFSIEKESDEIIFKFDNDIPVGNAVNLKNGFKMHNYGSAVTNGISSNSAQVYATGTAAQSAATVTGTGTTFTVAMIGGYIQYASGAYATIIRVNSTTSMTVDHSQTVAARKYKIYYNGPTMGVTNISAPRMYAGIPTINPIKTTPIQIFGPSSSANSPSACFYPGTAYPSMELFNWTNGDSSVNFDVYYDSGWKSSATSGNSGFILYNTLNQLSIRGGTSTGQGSAITLNTAFTVAANGTTLLPNIIDSSHIVNAIDITKKIKLDTSGIATNTTRTLAVPNANGKLVAITDSSTGASGKVLVALGTDTAGWSTPESAGIQKSIPIYIIKEEKSSGTSAGNSVAGVQDRDITSLSSHNGSDITVNISDVLTIGPGNYHVSGFVTGYGCGAHQAYFHNYTNAVHIWGTTSHASTGNQTCSNFDTLYSSASSCEFKLRHYIQNAVTDGKGKAGSFGGGELYATITFTKL